MKAYALSSLWLAFILGGTSILCVESWIGEASRFPKTPRNRSKNIVSSKIVDSGSPLIIPRVGGQMPPGRRPHWFHVPAPGGEGSHFRKLQESVRELGLTTVCEEGGPPEEMR